MLSIEEIKLLIEKLEKVKKEDLQKLIDSNLKILKDLALAIDANNDQIIDRLDKTPEWFTLDNQQKQERPLVNVCEDVNKEYKTNTVKNISVWKNQCI